VSLLLPMTPLTVVLSVLITCEVARVLFDSTSAIVPGGSTGGTVPSAASTAAFAFTMPDPHCEHVAGNGRAVLCRIEVT
jgi:hypothetical protein